jgi:hypothetical protein
MRRCLHKISEVWTVDLRSLALFRIGLGLLVLADLYLRAQPEFFLAFHTDDGVLSRSFLIDSVGDAWRLTPHMMSGTAAGITTLFVIEALCGCMLILGWRTRFMAAACWILTLGVQNRNPMVLQGGDVFFRLLLLAGIFLPLGARFSVDRLLQPDTNESNARLALKNNSFTSSASLFLLVQVMSVYVFSGVIKYHDPSWKEGLGVYYSLATYQFASSLGVFLSHQTALMYFSNWLVLALEVAAPLLLIFSPVRCGFVRFLTVVMFISFHISIVAVLFVGLFPWIGIVAWLPLLPAWFWEWVKRQGPQCSWEGFALKYTDGRDVCHRLAVIAARIVGMPRSHVHAVPREVHGETTGGKCVHGECERTGERLCGRDLQRYLLTRRISGWNTRPALCWCVAPLRVVIDAVTFIVAAVMRTPLRSYLAPSFRDAPFMYGTSYLSHVLCLIGLYVGFIYNLSTVPQLEYSPWVKRNNWVHLLGLDQNWAMFSRPFVDDGWFVFPAKLADGRDVDLFRDGAALTYEPPSLIATTFKGDRWRKYMTNIWASTGEKHRLPFGRYLCRTWNGAHPESERLETFEMMYMRQDTRPDGSKAPVTPVMMWRHECFDGMLKKWGKG